MILYSPESADPFINIALEEILLRKQDEEYAILYINDPSVVIGKHQSAHREIDTRYITENNIPVVRRISGGGTVFHDRGNLNFTFITNSSEGKQVDFRKHTGPVLGFLSSLGIDARFEGKNDIRVDGLKISGSAEHVFRNRVLHHGTLLFNASLESLSGSIRSDKSCYSTRAVDSNPAKVLNIRKHIKGIETTGQFRLAMTAYLSETIPGLEVRELSPGLLNEAESLASSKYRTWEWNFAYGPEYVFSNSFSFNGTAHTCTLHVRDGIISGAQLGGSMGFSRLSQVLNGCRHMVQDLSGIIVKEMPQLAEEEIYNFF